MNDSNKFTSNKKNKTEKQKKFCNIQIIPSKIDSQILTAYQTVSDHFIPIHIYFFNVVISKDFFFFFDPNHL